MLRSAVAALALLAVAAPVLAAPQLEVAPPAETSAQLVDAAATAESPAASLLAPAWLELIVNDVPKRAILVQLSGADVWVAAEDLEQAGLKVEGGERIDHAARSLVSLRSLAPDVVFTVDEAAVALHVRARQTLLGRTRLDLNRFKRPAELVTRDAPSAYLNWAARADLDGAQSAASELGVSAGRGLLLSGATIDSSKGAVRGLTTGTWDDEERLVRWAAGDVFLAPGDPLGGTGLVLGGSVAREFSLDPYAVRAPYPRTSVFASTPATLEVWVNDTLVRRTQVLPGTIDLDNVPVNAGLSEIRTVLRDAFGREDSASTYALFGSSILTPGLFDWGVSAGARRERFGTESFAYGSPLAMGRLRAGLTRLVTVGVRAEGGDGLMSGGASAALATEMGELEAWAAASRDGRDAGAALFAAWRRTGRRGGAVAQLRWDSGRYANASTSSDADRAVVRASVAGSFPLAARLSLLGELAGERRRDTDDSGRALLRLQWALPGGFSSGVSASRSFRPGGSGETEILVMFSIPAGGRSTADVHGAAGSRAGYAQVGLNHALREGPGVGYRLAARGGDGAFASAELQAQSRWARMDVEHQELDAPSGARSSHTVGQVASALVLIDGRVFPTRPVEGSYALVRVQGARGVRVSLHGQDVGRTDSDGELLVTGLVPYAANRLSIRDADLPLDYRVDEVERVVAPRRHGGTVERFKVAPLTAVVGTIVLYFDGAEVPPEWGEVAVEVDGRRQLSPIGEHGAFWLEDIPPGTHDALVRWGGRLCRFRFEVTEPAGMLDLGKVRCDQLLVQSSAR